MLNVIHAGIDISEYYLVGVLEVRSMHLFKRSLLNWSPKHFVILGDYQLQDLAQFVIELAVAVRLLLEHFAENNDQITKDIKLFL